MQKAKQLWDSLPDSVRRVIHTAYQVALPVLFTHLVMARSSKDVQAAVVAAGAVFLAAVKAAVLQ